jgi:hypothetical protein
MKGTRVDPEAGTARPSRVLLGELDRETQTFDGRAFGSSPTPESQA